MDTPRDTGATQGPHHDPAARTDSDTGTGENGRDEVLFDAIITPHRSLSPRGFTMLMAFIGCVSFISGVAFVSMGAWPVFGFFGLDVAAVYIAFRLNYRAARAVEHVVLTRNALTIRRFDPRGRTADEVTIQPYWLSVEVAGTDQADQIRLRSHGKVHTVGDWLSPPERESLADALRDALGALRAPPPVPGTAGSR